MKFTHYGKDVIIWTIIVTLVLFLISVLVDILVVGILLFSIALFLLIFSLYFFRDPDRKLPHDYKPNQIISPADGKVVAVEKIINKEENIFPAGSELSFVSIFLSPLNVHVNRIPIDGEVKYLKYIKGEYLVAFDHKSSERNERAEIGIENNETGYKVFFKQIAGYVARRIVYDIKPGSKVKTGERFGMIKFGSRVDIIFDKDAKIFVELNQKVKGGETVIAEL
jgi:phosphatidylserine decarboxylase